MEELSPQEIRNSIDSKRMPKTEKFVNGHWMHVNDTTVVIVAQKKGQASTAELRIPKKDFDAMVGFYIMRQELKELK